MWAIGESVMEESVKFTFVNSMETLMSSSYVCLCAGGFSLIGLGWAFGSGLALIWVELWSDL